MCVVVLLCVQVISDAPPRSAVWQADDAIDGAHGRPVSAGDGSAIDYAAAPLPLPSSWRMRLMHRGRKNKAWPCGSIISTIAAIARCTGTRRGNGVSRRRLGPPAKGTLTANVHDGLRDFRVPTLSIPRASTLLRQPSNHLSPFRHQHTHPLSIVTRARGSLFLCVRVTAHHHDVLSGRLHRLLRRFTALHIRPRPAAPALLPPASLHARIRCPARVPRHSPARQHHRASSH